MKTARWKKLEKPLLILAGAGALTTVLMSLELNLLEANFYDLRMTRGPQADPSGDIVLVALDDATVKAADDFSPLPLDFHVRFLESLESHYQPKAVGYLVDMNQVAQAEPDVFRGEWGPRFVAAATRLENRGAPVLLGTPFDVTGEVLPPYPLSVLPHALAFIHKDGYVFSDDKVTRRAPSRLYGRPTLHLDLAMRLGLVAKDHQPRGAFQVPEVEGEYFFFRYHGNTATRADLTAAAAPYRAVSFASVADGSIDPAALKDKILLVGTLGRESFRDYAFTPYSKAPFTNPRLLVHANILDSVIRDDGIVRAPVWAGWAATFAVTAFVLWCVLDSTPLYGVFATLILAFLYILAGQALFTFQGLWMRVSQPLVGIFVGYYLVVPYRLIREYKKRWDYQTKNEVLMQVEELKRNFLSLVTHDLKTPVARIQGLAEVLLRKAGERLYDRDKETVTAIISSTEELNRFISSILELTKIESNELRLKLESRDVNQILERAVEGFKAPARAKNIRLTASLDPLFPIKVDASLIEKVVNNLIDNALKYSPSGGEVAVESREVGEHVEIAVRDSGIGLTDEERESLFQRFYRAKNDVTVRTPGTGLGLYLTKYFIEAHHGTVEVESSPGAGSVFRIRLPIAPPAAPAKAAGLTHRVSARLPAGLTKPSKKEKSHV